MAGRRARERRRARRGNLPAAVLDAGADDRPRPHPRGRLRRSCERHAAGRRAQQGHAERTRRRDAAEAGYRQRHDPGPDRPRPGQRCRVLLPAAQGHRDLRRVRGARSRHHRPRPGRGFRRAGRELLASASATRRSATPPRRTGLARRRPRRQADRHVVPEPGARRPGRTRHRRHRHPARRRRGDLGAAGRRRRHRRRRRLRPHAAPARPGRVRRRCASRRRC